MISMVRKSSETNRRKAIETLGNVFWAIAPRNGMTQALAQRLAGEFVDAMTEHCLEATALFVDARLETREPARPNLRPSPRKRGRK